MTVNNNLQISCSKEYILNQKYNAQFHRNMCMHCSWNKIIHTNSQNDRVEYKYVKTNNFRNMSQYAVPDLPINNQLKQKSNVWNPTQMFTFYVNRYAWVPAKLCSNAVMHQALWQCPVAQLILEVYADTNSYIWEFEK